jgi:hypothetical protein
MLHQLLASWGSGDREPFFEQHRQRHVQLGEFLKETGLWSAMSSNERAFMLAPLDQIDAQASRNVSWSMESAECLLWALGYVEWMPPYDTQSDVEHLNLSSSDGVVALIRSATLRDAGVISNARDVAELWHWRSRTRQLQESGRPVELPKDLTLVEVIRMAAAKAAADGLFERVIGGDFPALGRSYAQRTADEWAGVASIAMERHKALNWLCGYAPGNKWEETPTET